MININIDQALIIINSLKMVQEMALLTISDFEKDEDKKKILLHENKISMLIKDLKYKLSNEILNL